MSRAWMPLFIADYLADTAHLSCLESGAYLHLIMHYWQNRGLPVEPLRLARIAKLTADEWEAVAPTIAEFFDDGWIHGRIEQELASSDAAYARRAAAGSKGGHAKAGNAKIERVDKSSNAIAMPEQDSSNAVAITLHHSTKLASSARASEEVGQSPPDPATVYRKCVDASGWSTAESPAKSHISPISDLIVQGVDLDGRILPIIRTVSAELRRTKRAPPDRWAYFIPAILDPERVPDAGTIPIETVLIRENDENWQKLVDRGKKPALLRSMLRPIGDGKGLGMEYPLCALEL